MLFFYGVLAGLKCAYFKDYNKSKILKTPQLLNGNEKSIQLGNIEILDKSLDTNNFQETRIRLLQDTLSGLFIIKY